MQAKMELFNFLYFFFRFSEESWDYTSVELFKLSLGHEKLRGPDSGITALFYVMDGKSTNRDKEEKFTSCQYNYPLVNIARQSVPSSFLFNQWKGGILVELSNRLCPCWE